MASSSSRSRGGKKRQREVIDAAVRIFNDRGYADTSVEDIASSLGILKGSLYYYISSKEDLLFHIVSEVHDDVQQLLDAAVARTDLDPLERIAFYVRSQVAYNATSIERISVYHQDMRQLGPERLRQIRRLRRAQDRMMIELITEAQELGQIDAGLDASLTAHSVFGTIIWIHTWYRPGGRVSPDELAAFSVEYALNGLTGAGRAAPVRSAAR